MIAKNIGWVLQLKETYSGGIKGNFYDLKIIHNSTYRRRLRDALVLDSRETARLCKGDGETIWKVSLTKAGRAKKIIGRG